MISAHSVRLDAPRHRSISQTSLWLTPTATGDMLGERSFGPVRQTSGLPLIFALCVSWLRVLNFFDSGGGRWGWRRTPQKRLRSRRRWPERSGQRTSSWAKAQLIAVRSGAHRLKALFLSSAHQESLSEKSCSHYSKLRPRFWRRLDFPQIIALCKKTLSSCFVMGWRNAFYTSDN